jgi:hypothetical protein
MRIRLIGANRLTPLEAEAVLASLRSDASEPLLPVFAAAARRARSKIDLAVLAAAQRERQPRRPMPANFARRRA